MANGPKLSNVVIPNMKDELSVLKKLESLIPSGRERILKSQLEAQQRIKEKEEALRLFSEVESKFPLLETKVGLAEKLGLQEIADTYKSRYNVDTSKSEAKLLQDITEAEDWREITANYQTIKSNPNSFYYNQVDKVANDRLKSIVNVDFINALKVQKSILDETYNDLKDLSGEQSKTLRDSFIRNQQYVDENGVFDVSLIQDPSQLQAYKDLNADIDRISSDMFDAETERNEIQSKIDNPIFGALSIINKELESNRERIAQENMSSILPGMSEDDPDISSDDLDFEEPDDVIERIMNLEMGDPDFEPEPEEEEESLGKLLAQNIASGFGVNEQTIETTQKLFGEVDEFFTRNKINTQIRLINSPTATEFTKERARKKLAELMKDLEE